jgi:hypothetical protein
VVAGSLGIMAVILIARPQATRTPATSPLGAIRTLHTAQVQYYSQNGMYAASLKDLGPAGAALMEPELASGTKYGYKFTMTGDGSRYEIHAGPQECGRSGSRTFYSDQTMVIRQNDCPQPATVSSPELK